MNLKDEVADLRKKMNALGDHVTNELKEKLAILEAKVSEECPEKGYNPMEGDYCFHDTGFTKWIFIFTHKNGKMICGSYAINYPQKATKEMVYLHQSYSNTTVKELRPATLEEKLWLDACIDKQCGMQLNDAIAYIKQYPSHFAKYVWKPETYAVFLTPYGGHPKGTVGKIMGLWSSTCITVDKPYDNRKNENCNLNKTNVKWFLFEDDAIAYSKVLNLNLKDPGTYAVCLKDGVNYMYTKRGHIYLLGNCNTAVNLNLGKSEILFTPDQYGENEFKFFLTKDEADKFADTLVNFQVGQWVYWSGNCETVGKIKQINGRYLALDVDGNCTNHNSCFVEHIRYATTEEVKQFLIKCAEKRGLVHGVKYKNMYDCTGIINMDKWVLNQNFDLMQKPQSNSSYTIYEDGKWAQVVKEDNIVVLPFGDTKVHIYKDKGYVRTSHGDISFEEINAIIRWYHERPSILTFPLEIPGGYLKFGCQTGTLDEIRAIVKEFYN